MKGIVMSYTLFVVMVIISLFLIWLIQYEMIRTELLSEFKTSFRITMQECVVRRCSKSDAMEVMSEYLKLNDSMQFAELSLMGYRMEPFMLRFELEAKKRQGFWVDRYFISLAMIEEVNTSEIP